MVKAKDFVPSKIQEYQLENCRKLCNFPSSAILRVPSPEEKPEEIDDDTVVVYLYPFELGYSFPFTPLVRSFLSKWRVNLGQLLPSIWRTLSLVETLTRNWEKPITYEDILSAVTIKKTPPFTYSFKKRPNVPVLIEQKDVNDRGWKEKYFFVRKDSLGEAGNFMVGGWSISDIYLEAVGGPTEAISRFIKEFSLVERTFPPEANPPARLLKDKSEEEMASKQVMDEAELLQRVQRRKRQLGSSTPSSSSMPPAKRRQGKEDAPLILVSPSKSSNVGKPEEEKAEKGLCLEFPPNFLSSHNPELPSDQIEKFLFPAAASRLQFMEAGDVSFQGLGYLLQALQNGIVSARHARDLAIVSKSQAEKIEELSKQIKQLEKAKKDSDKAKTKAEAALKPLEDKLKEKDDTIDQLREELKDAEASATFFTRARVAHEVIFQKKPEDELKKYIDAWLMVGSIADLGPAPTPLAVMAETGGSQVGDEAGEQVVDSGGKAAAEEEEGEKEQQEGGVEEAGGDGST